MGISPATKDPRLFLSPEDPSKPEEDGANTVTARTMGHDSL